MLRKLILLVMVSIMFSGCASLLERRTQKVSINTNTGLEGAKIYLNDAYTGEGTEKVEVPIGYKANKVTVKKDGYKDGSKEIKNRIAGGWLILDIFTGIIPLVVDLITGDIFSSPPRKVDILLEKNK